MIRRLAPLLLLVPLLLAAVAPPKPAVSTLGGAWTWVNDSTIARSVETRLSGPLGKNDVIRYTLSINGGASVELARTKATDTTFTFAAPAYDQTLVYKLCARVFRGESASGGFKCNEWPVTRGPAPEPPPPVVDTVIVRPASVNLQPGQTQQFCAFCRAGGAWLMCGPQAGERPYCDQQFQQFLDERQA